MESADFNGGNFVIQEAKKLIGTLVQLPKVHIPGPGSLLSSADQFPSN